MLDVRSLSKTFPGQVALDEASLRVERGQIHALVGQNGSGKSTLIKLLTAYHEPDPGSDVWLGGRQVDLTRLSQSDHERIHVMHQDLGLVGSLNAIENLALGRGFRTSGGRIRWPQEAERVATHLASFGVHLDVRRPVSGLSAAEQAMLALARATQDWEDADGLLILDEPTASLPLTEVERLFSAVRELADRGAAVVFVSHRLDEVFTLADHITVLRDGRTVATGAIDEFDHDSLIRHIVGRQLDDLYGHHDDAHHDEVLHDTVRVRVRDLWGDAIRGVSFDVHRGEILGVAGLTGSGREEIGRLIFDGSARARGAVEIDGEPVSSDIPGALAAGVAYVPADRKRLGSIQSSSVADNISLPGLRAFVRGLRLDHGAVRRECARWIERVDVRPRDPGALLSTLSGGNQQKTVLARWLRRDPDLLVLDEPTQGVDVGAKASIYELLTEAAAAGTSVVLVSSDTEELANVCDRVLVLRDGEVATMLQSAALDEDALVRHIWSFDDERV